MASGTLVVGKATEDGKLNPVVPELIGIGSRLGGRVTVALLGSGVEGLAREAAAFGASKVIVVDDAILKEYQGDSYVPIAERIAKEVDPAVIVMGQTMMGRDMAPRLAQRLGTAGAGGLREKTGGGRGGEKGRIPGGAGPLKKKKRE